MDSEALDLSRHLETWQHEKLEICYDLKILDTEILDPEMWKCVPWDPETTHLEPAMGVVELRKSGLRH